MYVLRIVRLENKEKKSKAKERLLKFCASFSRYLERVLYVEEIEEKEKEILRRICEAFVDRKLPEGWIAGTEFESVDKLVKYLPKYFDAVNKMFEEKEKEKCRIMTKLNKQLQNSISKSEIKIILRNICKHKNIDAENCQVCEAYFQLIEIKD